ncbi:hypothetical protein F0U44_20375 [Nocardioides humilatus]|uniref:Uncharacterized protein n=1 Tax=Nocardioides humilatus TaxID=2607660 RepID=A0A5B1L646_9ACTN|nr:hypothetical protein [Nocardioides humilatus]KAA1415985.1 hypothetical protein F0U44_20375 [Nocardioides humilatus]
MSDDDSATNRPVPTAVPPEPSPGGPHAVPGVGGDGPYSRVPRDLDPNLNPATDDNLPEETTEGEDTETEATKGGEPTEAESEPA